MPELPEVQTTVDGLNKTVKGLIIKDVWTSYKSDYHAGKDNIKDPKFFSMFKKSVIGQKIKSAERKAKNILIHLSNDKTILVHMKMTGHLLYGKYVFDKKGGREPWKAVEEGPLKDPFNRFVRLIFELSDGLHLALSDMRRFAKVTLLDSKKLEETLHLKDIGPDPLDKSFDVKLFTKQLSKKPTGRIKNVLMDQSVIAGVGNIYSDEALWKVGIHPEERVKNIPKEKLKLLYKATVEVLKKGIDFGGDSMSDYRNIHGERGAFQGQHQAYRKTGKPCTKKGCKGTIIKKVVGGRSAHFCDTHQKLSSKSK